MTEKPPKDMTVQVPCACGEKVTVRFGTGKPQLYVCESCGRTISITHEIAPGVANE